MPTMSKESRDLMVEIRRKAEREAPGVGRLEVSKKDLLAMLGFKEKESDLTITGVAWRGQTLFVDLVSTKIHWQGGVIVSTDPIQTDTQERGEAED